MRKKNSIYSSVYKLIINLCFTSEDPCYSLILSCLRWHVGMKQLSPLRDKVGGPGRGLRAAPLPHSGKGRTLSDVAPWQVCVPLCFKRQEPQLKSINLRKNYWFL